MESPRDRRDMSGIELDSYHHDAEDAPFLDADEPPSNQFRMARSFTSPRLWQVKSPSSIVLMAAIAKFAIVASGLMMMMPLYRLIEDAICHVHYKDDSVDLIEEMKCKVDDVQKPLAYLLGWLGLIGAITNFIVAYPYGILSDTYGRKPIIITSYVAQAVSFCMVPFALGELRIIVRQNPLVLLWGSLFTLIGGGVPVLMTTFYAIVSDVSTEKSKTAGFLYLAMGVAGGALLGPLLAGILMARYGPWVPIYVTLFAIPPILIILIMIPETLVKKQKSDGAKLGMRDHIANGIKEFSSAFQILKNVNVCLVLVVFFFLNPRAAAQSSILTQYISKHFGWTLAQTSILLSPLGILEMLVLGLLPKLSDVLTSPRFGFTNFRSDLFLTRVSMLLLAVATLILGISTNIVIFLFALFVANLGSAENPLARATVSHFVDPAYTSRLYALIGMVEVLGSFTGGPVLAWFFSKGLELKGIFTGLPWFYVSFLCFLTFTALLFVKPPPPGKSSDDGTLSDDDEIRPDNPVRLD